MSKTKDYIAGRLLEAAATSEDPDTQTACVAVKYDFSALMPAIVAQASNRMANNVERLPERLVRPDKYSWIMHAESILICNAARNGMSMNSNTMVLNWFPCSNCANMIVQSGFTTLVADRDKYELRKDDPRYDFKRSMDILQGRVKVVWMDEWEP